MSSVDRIVDTLRKLIRSEFADYSYTGIYEYSIQSVIPNLLTGRVTVNCEPTDTTLSLPSISNMIFRGNGAQPVVGNLCLVSFINRSPQRPIIVEADGAVATEHLMTTEACVLLIYNTLSTLSLALIALGLAPTATGALLGVVLQPLITPAILAAMTAQNIPGPPTLPAQVIAAAAQAATMAAGTAPSNTIGPFAAQIPGLELKTEDVSGLFPGIGCPNTKSS